MTKTPTQHQDNGLLTLSELATVTGVSVHAIRSYVAERLIPRAGKTRGGFGLFDRNAVARLDIIRAARAASLPLQTVRPLLQALNGADPAVVATSIKAVECTLRQCRKQLAALSALMLALRETPPPDCSN